MNYEMKWCGRKRSWPNIKYYPGIFLEKLRKTTKDLSQDMRSTDRDLNPGSVKYEAGVLTTEPRHTVKNRENGEMV
jgi:hypothetical protein